MPGSAPQHLAILLGYRPLARSWLVPLLVLPALALAPSGCLVTESPSFDVAQAVPPKIVPVTPPALVIRATKKGFHYDVPSFKFRVVSEEVDNKNLLSVLLIDYGTLGPDGSSPWSDPQDGDVITPGKLMEISLADFIATAPE